MAITVQDGVPLSLGASSSQQFTLNGGKYAIAVVGTGFGSVALQRVGADAATLANAVAAWANGFVVADLPPGTYQFTVTTATGVFVQINSVPVFMHTGAVRNPWSLANPL
jgi:hypothetical protein